MLYLSGSSARTGSSSCLILCCLAACLTACLSQTLAGGYGYNPFAGSGCTCKTFCAGACAIDASVPANETFFGMTPKGVLDMTSKDTGNAEGDTSFVLSRKTMGYQCSKNPDQFFCKNIAQFSGDERNSTDLIIQFVIERDGQWGPYMPCNPVNTSNPLGPWKCSVSLAPGTGDVAQECKKLNYTNFEGYRWKGLGAKNTTVADIGSCCDVAAGKSYNYYNVTRQCETFAIALEPEPHSDVQAGYVDNSPPPCNCSRVHRTVGRANLTDLAHRSHAPAGGLWFSHPAAGQCKPGQWVGDGSGCTWRLIKTTKIVRAECVYQSLDKAVENHNASCFEECPQPHNVTSNCYLKCYSESTLGMSPMELTAPWQE